MEYISPEERVSAEIWSAQESANGALREISRLRAEVDKLRVHLGLPTLAEEAEAERQREVADREARIAKNKLDMAEYDAYGGVGFKGLLETLDSIGAPHPTGCPCAKHEAG